MNRSILVVGASIIIPKSVVPAMQNNIHMYASSNISISGTTLCLGPVMYVWKCVQCRLWPKKENQSIWCFCFGLGALYYFWQKNSNTPFLSDNVLAIFSQSIFSEASPESRMILVSAEWLAQQSSTSLSWVFAFYQRWRPLLSLTGDNVQIYCESTAQVIAVCALFATHAIVLNWYSVCRWLIYSHL